MFQNPIVIDWLTEALILDSFKSLPTFGCRNGEAECTLCKHADDFRGRLGKEEGEGEGGGLGQQEVEDGEAGAHQQLRVRVHRRDKVGKAEQVRMMSQDEVQPAVYL